MGNCRWGLSVSLFLLFVGSTALFAGGKGNFVGHLTGDQEVPPFETQAQGQAIFKLRGDTLSHKLIVANIEDIWAAHLHCAQEGANGPVGITLFFGSPVTINGILTQGELLAPASGNGCGWSDIDDVINAIMSGDTYVNVHTLQNLPGEIRGQIR